MQHSIPGAASSQGDPWSAALHRRRSAIRHHPARPRILTLSAGRRAGRRLGAPLDTCTGWLPSISNRGNRPIAWSPEAPSRPQRPPATEKTRGAAYHYPRKPNPPMAGGNPPRAWVAQLSPRTSWFLKPRVRYQQRVAQSSSAAQPLIGCTALRRVVLGAQWRPYPRSLTSRISAPFAYEGWARAFRGGGDLEARGRLHRQGPSWPAAEEIVRGRERECLCWLTWKTIPPSPQPPLNW